MEHPNLVRYISISDDGILMEYVDGETLTQRLVRQPEYFKERKNTDKFTGEETDVRTNIFAIGRIIELLPNRHI